MHRRLDALAMPWQDARACLRRAILAIIAAVLFSTAYCAEYSAQCTEQARMLKHYVGNDSARIADYINYIGLQPFWIMARLYLLPLPLLGTVLLLGGIAANYLHCRTGARSDYTLRRLRDPWEYHRRCLALPLAAMVLSLAVFALLTVIYYQSYLRLTPPELLPPAGQRFWG